MISFSINPLTAPACNIFALKASWTDLQTVYFSQSNNRSNFNAMRFHENPFTCQCEKEQKGIKVSNFTLLSVVYKLHHDSDGVKNATSAVMVVCRTCSRKHSQMSQLA